MAKSRNEIEQRPQVGDTQAIAGTQATEPRRSARLEQKSRSDKVPRGVRQFTARSQKRKQSNNHDGAIGPPLRNKRQRNSVEAVYPLCGKHSPISYWSQTGRWPKEYFKLDEQTKKYITRDVDKESWFENYLVPNMQHCLARKKSSSSLRGRRSEPGASEPTSTTPSDQRLREEKSIPYQDPRYETLLKSRGVFLTKSKKGVTQESKKWCRLLLESDNDVPDDSLFRDDLFEAVCEEIQNRNEAKVIQDISRLIVPSAQQMAVRGSKGLEVLIESVNEGWNNSIPLTKTRPQSDYAVGFRREAFTEEQLQKLQPFVGQLSDTSFFMATWFMYFPFLTCEVKCGAAALDIADRQNAHSMTLALRASATYQLRFPLILNLVFQVVALSPEVAKVTGDVQERC